MGADCTLAWRKRRSNIDRNKLLNSRCEEQSLRLLPKMCIDALLSHFLRAALFRGQKGTHIWLDGSWRVGWIACLIEAVGLPYVAERGSRISNFEKRALRRGPRMAYIVKVFDYSTTISEKLSN
jgi:hypothetical protein